MTHIMWGMMKVLNEHHTSIWFHSHQIWTESTSEQVPILLNYTISQFRNCYCCSFPLLLIYHWNYSHFYILNVCSQSLWDLRLRCFNISTSPWDNKWIVIVFSCTNKDGGKKSRMKITLTFIDYTLI